MTSHRAAARQRMYERTGAGDFSGRTFHDKVLRYAAGLPVGTVFYSREVNAVLPPSFRADSFSIAHVLTRASFIRRTADGRFERVYCPSVDTGDLDDH